MGQPQHHLNMSHGSKTFEEPSTSIQAKLMTYQFAGSAFLSLFTAPLTASYVSLQMAVLSNKPLSLKATQQPKLQNSKVPLTPS